MKKILFPIVLVSALLSVVSCSKSFDASEEGLAESSESKFFTATTESDNSKTTLVKDAGTLKVYWVQGDEISINGTTYAATPKEDKTKATFTKTVGDDPSSPYTAYYPASLYNGTTATLPASQTYDPENPFSVNPMYAYSTTTSLSFKNICSVLRITTSEAVTSIEVSCNDKVLNGVFTVDDNNKAVMSKTTDIVAADRKVTLTCASDTARIFFIPIPAQEYTSLRITLNNTNNTKTMIKSIDRTLERNKIYKTSFVPNAFSVSNSKQVIFSTGNLYCKKESGTWNWHFYDQQYQYNSYPITTPMGNRTATADDTEIDLFTWGYSSDWSTNPTTTSYNNGTSSLSVSGETDWGTVMGTGSGWYTLSKSEWEYLLAREENSKYGYATVADKKGIIILPDFFTDPKTNDGSGAFVPSATTGWTANVYTSGGNWEAMESAGAVFLPAAGSRSGANVSGVTINGYYWSSTPDSNDNNKAYGPAFGKQNAYLYDGKRSSGRSVRLVRE